MRNPATPLFRYFERFCIRETDHFIVAFLFNELAKINRSAIDPDGCSCLQSLGLETEFLQLFGDAETGHLTHPASREMLLSDMD